MKTRVLLLPVALLTFVGLPAAPARAAQAVPAPPLPQQARPAPAPYVPAPVRMTRDEAVARSYETCRERRFECRLLTAALDGDVWLVELEARRGMLAGPMHLGYDAWARTLVAVDEPEEPRLMTPADATARGYQVCVERGYQCRILSSSLAGNVWRVDFDARRGPVAGPLHLELDAFTRAVLRMDEPRPPPQPRLMTYEEATSRGMQLCSERGFQCRPVDAALAANVWRVELDARRADVAGRLHVELDALTRAVLRLDEPRPPRPMTYDEATSRGMQVCSERGYQCRPLEAALVANVWRIELDASRTDVAGRLHLELDSVTRAVLRLDEPRPPPAVRPMTYDEATAQGVQVCSERGYECRFLDGALADNVWRLDLDARRADATGPFHLEVDALTRAVLRVDEPPRIPPRPARPMRAREAAEVGIAWCDDHGYDCRVLKTQLTRGGKVWKVRLAVDDPGGQVRLELDAFTRAVLDAHENIRAAQR
jgi:hypothetical protein